MKRFISALLAVCFCCAFAAVGLVGCGSDAGSANYNVSDVAGAVEAVAKIENPFEITEDDLYYEFGVDTEKIAEFSGHKTGIANAAGTVLVIKANAGSAQDVKTALENYQSGVVSVSENYKSDFPDAYQQISDGRIVVKGDYVVLAIAAAGVDYTEIDTAIDEAFQ